MTWYTKLPTLKVSSPSHFFKSPELINSSWDHNVQESGDKSSKAPVQATCSEIWSPAFANKAPQATVRQQPCKALSHVICHLSILFAFTCTGVCKPLQKNPIVFCGIPWYK